MSSALSTSAANVAARLKLRRAARGEWRGFCPACGYGNGAFTLRQGEGDRLLAWCASCQDKAAVYSAIGGHTLQVSPRDREARAGEQARKRDNALRLWRSAEPVRGTPAENYLAARNIPHLVSCPDLAFLPDCHHPHGGHWLALVALVRDPAGEPCAIHRTYLRRDGSGKAAVEPNKASLGPTLGGAIRLAPEASELAIGEGIETAAAAGLLAGMGAWVGISAGNVGKALVLPIAVRNVTLAVDRDPPGERASREAAARWRAEGRSVRFLVPDAPGTDAADVLAAPGAAHV